MNKNYKVSIQVFVDIEACSLADACAQAEELDLYDIMDDLCAEFFINSVEEVQ